jgi:co-chaperonin GroES (HSP10)
MSFQLNDSRIAVQTYEVEEASPSGLILTESAKSPLRYGTVTHVGNGHLNERGEPVVPRFNVDDEVFFHRASGQALEIGGEEYVILQPHEIIGTVAPGVPE